MPISRRFFLAGATGLVSSSNALSPLNAQGAGSFSHTSEAELKLPYIKLRGYGGLSAEFHLFQAGQASVTRISCESALKARLVQAKYLSDLTRLPGKSAAAMTIAGHEVPISAVGSHGAVACYAHENNVLLLAAASTIQLKRLCETLLPHTMTRADFTARVQVPMWLDRWDNYGLLFYYGPFETPPNSPVPSEKYDYSGDFRFVKDNGGGFVIWSTPGNELSWAWMQNTARKMHIPVHVNTSNDWPRAWLSNKYRAETQLRMPQFLGGFYDVGWQSGPLGAISWNSQAGEDALLGTFQQTVRRYVKDPNIVGWLEPHAETAHMPSDMMCEYGPTADASLRRFLQGRYGSIVTVSKRWTGDPRRYKSWMDIHAPEIAEFAGFGPNAIDLRGTWRVKYVLGPNGEPNVQPPVQAPPEWGEPGFDDSGWDEFVAPGNDRMIRMPRAVLCYRRTVVIPPEWLDAARPVTLYVWDLSDRPDDELVAYVNGLKIPWQPRKAAQVRWVAFDVTHAVKPGANVIVLSEPKGIMCYRTYLATAPPLQYPELGPFKNAMWADFTAWTLWSREEQMRRGTEMIRQVDADRNINFMAPSEDIGPITRICQEYGGCFHDTGGMAGYWTEDNTLVMRGAGLPATAEPGGGADNASDFQAYWGRWLTEGLNGVHYFQRLGEIIWRPEILAQFVKNRRMYEAIGKYHAPFAEVAMLYSTRNARLTFFPWDANRTDKWQVGGYNSGWNSAAILQTYCPRDTVTEEALGAGHAAQYRVIIDSNTTFMNDAVLDRIERYVRAGGVFVTYGETGRHTEVEPDTWPISRLTGYTVLAPHVNRKLSLPPGQMVFFGQAWSDLSGSGQTLKKTAPECIDLLVSPDGATAAGMRPVGKGWIVHLGVTLGNGMQETMLHQLLAHFGVRNLVPARVAPQPGLFFRHFVGNTGLQDIWVVFNDSTRPVTTDITFLPEVHPSSLVDIVTNEQAAIRRDRAGDSVQGVSLAPRETKMFVSPRANIVESPLEWIKLQRNWWQGTRQPPARRLPTAVEEQPFSLDLTQNWAYKRIDGLTDAEALPLAQPAYDDRSWPRQDLDVWDTPGGPDVKRLLLRRKFTVPERWGAGTTLIAGARTVIGAITYLDGAPLFNGQLLRGTPLLDTLTGVLKPGTTHLLTIDIKNMQNLMGVRDAPQVFHIPEPQARQDLSGEWITYLNGWHKSGLLTLPGHTTKAEFLSRTVKVDKAQSVRNVMIYAKTQGNQIQGVIVNGLRLDGQGNYILINITPLIKFDQQNTLELVLHDNEEDMTITSIELRYYDREFYP